MERMLDPKTAYKERIAVQPGGDLLMLIDRDLQSRSHRNFCVTQNVNCSPGIGAGASTSAKNHPLSGTENRWFCQSGYQVALLASTESQF